MPDLLDEKHKEITERLKELSPIVEEHRRLQAAAKALAGIRRAAAATVTTRRSKPGRPRSAATATTSAPAKKPGRPKRAGRPPAAAKAGSTATAPRRAGRRKGSGTRAAQALAFVREQPGITIPELATKMGIKQNYLYRVLPGLEKDGKLRKQGRGWHPKGK
jgi:hypothetical protein